MPKSLWKSHQHPTQAPDVERLQQQVQFLQVNYHEVYESDRVIAIRERWRLFSHSLEHVCDVAPASDSKTSEGDR